jgi:hypothetical protein
LAKRGGSPLQRREAEKIAAKLGAVREGGGAHILAKIYYDDGTLVANFGIRHGGQSGHGHLPKALGVNQQFAVALASCTKSKADYFAELRRKGQLP